jgi:hypothetical protein
MPVPGCPGVPSSASTTSGGRYVSHHARHTLATNLLRHRADLHHIRRYLGHVSERMTEHNAKIALSEIEDVLQHVWVAGPGAPDPGPRPLQTERGLPLCAGGATRRQKPPVRSARGRWLVVALSAVGPRSGCTDTSTIELLGIW